MNPGEFSFFNQQLASMLRDGIPLEGALKQLSRTMSRGMLRVQIDRLGQDLAAGVPLEKAIEARAFPPLYAQVLKAAARSNNLPGFLTLLADYYARTGEITARLQSLLVYPAVVLVLSLGLSLWFTRIFAAEGLAELAALSFGGAGFGQSPALGAQARLMLSTWGPPLALIGLALAAAAAIVAPPVRRWLAWRLPAFREASISRVAQSLGLLIQGGLTLAESLAIARGIECSVEIKRELEGWIERVAAGESRFDQVAARSRMFPPLFVWLVAAAGEDLGGGFLRTADVYRARAALRCELLLNAVLPASLLVLGLMLLMQIYPFASILQDFVTAMGGVISGKR